MNKEYSINFIDSLFTTEEAASVLLDIFSSKIKFHELKNMGYKERFGYVDEIAQQRIEDLKKSRQILFHILAEAKESNCDLKVNSSISLQLKNKISETIQSKNEL